ncbi:MAG: hypothetical protein HQL56_16685 [Magnetococcales bacterium]|nr:hypothetical protein [Magnetococcales bacterium]
MRVLLITEDPTYDQHLLKPLLEAMFAHLDRAKVRVRVCTNPVYPGVENVLKNLCAVTSANPMVDLYLLVVDRDGKSGRRQMLDRLETENGNLLAAHAIEEVEVWTLAGLEHAAWKEIRQATDAKERFFQPLAAAEYAHFPFGGYKEMGLKAAANYKRMRQLCQEDLLDLENRLAGWLAARAT